MVDMMNHLCFGTTDECCWVTFRRRGWFEVSTFVMAARPEHLDVMISSPNLQPLHISFNLTSSI